MAGLNVNSDNRVADLLIELNRHLKICRQCTGAVKTRDKYALCDHTIGLILTLAITHSTVIPRRLMVRRENKTAVYSCPDLRKHGMAYSMTAEPLIVVGVQGELF